MNTSPHRLSGLLALTILVACDSSSAAPKGAPPAKAEVGNKAAPASAEPAKAEPANAEPANVEPANAEPANAEPSDPVDEVADPSPSDPVEPSDPAEPSDLVEPTEPAGPTPGEAFSPVSIGSNAKLLKLVLAHDVVKRQPVDPATTFASGTKVNLFIEASNESDADIRLSVTWENVKSGRRSPPVPVTIPVRDLHRTRAYRTLKLVGEQRVIVLGEDGEELAVLPFTIE